MHLLQNPKTEWFDGDIKWELLHYLLFLVKVTLLSLMFSLSKQNIDFGPLEFASKNRQDGWILK